MPGPAFKTAVEHSRQLTDKPSNDELLELYALSRIATGEDFEKAEKPGMLDIKGKFKYNAWKKEVEAGTTADAAEERFIKLVEKLKVDYGYDASKKPEPLDS